MEGIIEGRIIDSLGEKLAVVLSSAPLPKDVIEVKVDVEDKNGKLGRVELVYDIRESYNKLLRNLEFVGFAALIAFLVSSVLTYYLNGVISKPITRFAKEIEKLSESHDYSKRIEKGSSDEIGSLIDRFNQLLDLIELRDKKLSLYSEELEAEVEKRTGELKREMGKGGISVQSEKQVFLSDNVAPNKNAFKWHIGDGSVIDDEFQRRSRARARFKFGGGANHKDIRRSFVVYLE